MAIILPHGVLFRGGAEERIRTNLLKDGHCSSTLPNILRRAIGRTSCGSSTYRRSWTLTVNELRKSVTLAA
jgi:hypothetical protein